MLDQLIANGIFIKYHVTKALDNYEWCVEQAQARGDEGEVILAKERLAEAKAEAEALLRERAERLAQG
jgi:hypothetical protein